MEIQGIKILSLFDGSWEEVISDTKEYDYSIGKVDGNLVITLTEVGESNVEKKLS